MTDATVNDPAPVTVTIPAAMRASGLGRTKIYELIARNEIESVRVGARRLVVFASLKARLTANAARDSNESGSR